MDFPQKLFSGDYFFVYAYDENNVVLSHPDSIERYFTKLGHGMSFNVSDEHLDFPQKLFSGDYLFFYAYDDNNVVVLINHTPYSADTQEDNMLD